MAIELIEGSLAIAHGAALCRPGVISAYPITPQTHIVEMDIVILENGIHFRDIRITGNYDSGISEFTGGFVGIPAVIGKITQIPPVRIQRIIVV